VKELLPSFLSSFTFWAFALICMFGISAMFQASGDPDDAEVNIKHSRQDIRWIAYLLGGILIMLGVIADRMH
jgi:hypothetical protein